jgi:hypothetical protein
MFSDEHFEMIDWENLDLNQYTQPLIFPENLETTKKVVVKKKYKLISKKLQEKYEWLNDENIIYSQKQWKNLLQENNVSKPCILLKTERKKY